MKKVIGLIIKEIKEYAKEKTLLLTYLLPLAMIFIIGYGLNLDTEHVRTLIVDRDKTSASQKFSQQFYNTKYFDTQTREMSDEEAMKQFRTNKIDLLIMIPSSFEKNLIKGATVHLSIYIDGVYPMTSKTITGYVKAAFYNFISKETLLKPKIIYEPRNLFNQAMRTKWAIIPGAIALILLLVPAMFSALMVVKEKERGTIFNFYASSLSKSEFLIGKVLPSFVINLVTIVVLFLMAIFLFDLPLRGSISLYFISSVLFLLISIGIGLLVSNVTKSQVAAIMLTALVTILPGVLYSGMMTPIDAMDGTAYVMAHLYPIMYFVKIMYDIFLIGDGLSSPMIIEYLLILMLFVIAIYLLNYLLLRKKL